MNILSYLRQKRKPPDFQAVSRDLSLLTIIDAVATTLIRFFSRILGISENK
jgi:hypothetical protein